MTKLQNLEHEAMLAAPHNRAVILVISALRGYRQAVANLRDLRYSDGECDAVTMTGFFDTIDEIEENPA